MNRDSFPLCPPSFGSRAQREASSLVMPRYVIFLPLCGVFILMELVVSEEIEILSLLQLHYPDSSKTTLRQWLAQGCVMVDGLAVTSARFLLARGSKIVIDTHRSRAYGNLSILYHDKHLVVIEKPVGLLSVATDSEKQKTAHAFLKKHYAPRKVHVVHRLDQEASGLLLFALSDEARDRLKDAFEAHAIERDYMAVVEGGELEEKGCWRSYLKEDASYIVHVVDRGQGKLAVTHYRVAQRSTSRCLLSVSLETGRKNQIRVQCQAAGHPIVGDIKYGASTDPVGRLCLHAYQLRFKHPITGKALRFQSAVPESFYKLVT